MKSEMRNYGFIFNMYVFEFSDDVYRESNCFKKCVDSNIIMN